MRWLQSEYLLKGIYLGLVLYAALLQPSWEAIGLTTLCTLGGLSLALVVAAIAKLRLGYRPNGRLFAFVLFLLLESPTLVYLGILGGTLAGALILPRLPDFVPPANQDEFLFLKLAGGGAVLGLLFLMVRDVKERWYRLVLCLALAVALVAGALSLFGYHSEWLDVDIPGRLPPQNMLVFAVQILIIIPIFYLLTFAGREEETEVEIGVLCAALGVGLLLITSELHTRFMQSLPFLLPVALYFVYTWRILPGLRVFKHTLRGFSYSRVGRHRQALLAFRRALELDPANTLAREGYWSVHRALDLNKLAKDPQTLAVVDFELCVTRAGSLLLESPTPARREEAGRLLDLVGSQEPALLPQVDYWRAVLLTHAGDLAKAGECLARVLDPSVYGRNSAPRRAVLLQAWQLALTLHPGLREQVGEPQLKLPGRRMEAIGAVERHLAAAPQDEDVWGLKRILYSDVTEAEYNDADAGDGSVQFDYAYAQQLGLALINDAQRWQRGGEYLRLAARGMPAMGPSIFVQIAQAHDRAGNPDGAWHNYDLAKKAGHSVGPANLSDQDRQMYFAVVKMLGDSALERGDLDAALDNYRLYIEYERSGIETLRTIAEIYERMGDPLSALHYTEMALLYSAKDRDLLARKDKYYYSVLPEDLQTRLETHGRAFDVDYCLRKARALLDTRDADLELLTWAQHLARLALVVQPASVRARVLLARAELRRGEREAGVAQLEQVRTNKPEQFATEDDAEAWHVACGLLGRLYLDELGRPDLAVACFNDFRQSPKSGADTLYRLGQAYEQIGDRARAVKFYEHVAAYDGHPLVWEAKDAVQRLKQSSPTG